jgi:hypothetical protein
MSVNVYIAAGRPTDPGHDFAPIVRAILASGYAAYYSGHLGRPYVQSTVTLAAHDRVFADRTAVIHGAEEDAPLFASSGSFPGLRILGGQWGNASALWKHTGSSQAVDCEVEGVRCSGMTGPAIDLSACVHCRISAFVASADYGVALGGMSVANSNRIRLRAQQLMEAAIWMRGATTGHRSNVIEHLTSDNGGRALLIDGSVSGLEGYIDSEPAVGATAPDVEINAPDGMVTGVVLGGFFGTMRAGQSSRVQVSGAASVTLDNLQVYVKSGGVVVSTSSSRTVRAIDVEIRDLGARVYADTLSAGEGAVEIIREVA